MRTDQPVSTVRALSALNIRDFRHAYRSPPDLNPAPFSRRSLVPTAGLFSRRLCRISLRKNSDVGLDNDMGAAHRRGRKQRCVGLNSQGP